MPAKKVTKRKAPEPEASESSSSDSKRTKEEEEEGDTPAMIRCPRPPTLKLASWNINGVRAWLGKEGMKFITEEKPDVLTLQETKCQDKDLPSELRKVAGYHTYWVASDKAGYAGVGLLSKIKPLSVKYGLGSKKHDTEGRLITAEYDDFYFVAAYVPNSGRGLVRLKYRCGEWEKDLRTHLQTLDKTKPVIYTGDLNVSHKEIDLSNPKANVKNAGFTPEERAEMTALLATGFRDVFRALNPGLKGAYSYWTYMANARARNVGWRLDYFLVSERFCDSICDSLILSQYMGSDHCPITLSLAL